MSGPGSRVQGCRADLHLPGSPVQDRGKDVHRHGTHCGEASGHASGPQGGAGNRYADRHGGRRPLGVRRWWRCLAHRLASVCCSVAGCCSPRRRACGDSGGCGDCGGCEDCGATAGGCAPTTTVCQKVWVPNVVTKEVPVTVCKTVVENQPYEYCVTVCKPETAHVPGPGLRVGNGHQDAHGPRVQLSHRDPNQDLPGLQDGGGTSHQGSALHRLRAQSHHQDAARHRLPARAL